MDLFIGISVAIVALLVLDACALRFGADSRDAWCTDSRCTPSRG